jgi:hypothetical protein
VQAEKDKPLLTGHKNDDNKPRFDLIPQEALWRVAEVLSYGAAKYQRDGQNWRHGMLWHRPLAAMYRHMSAWQRGERFDRESGLPHLAHAMASLLFLLTYEETDAPGDDRWKPIKKEPEDRLNAFYDGGWFIDLMQRDEASGPQRTPLAMSDRFPQTNQSQSKEPALEPGIEYWDGHWQPHEVFSELPQEKPRVSRPFASIRRSGASSRPAPDSTSRTPLPSGAVAPASTPRRSRRKARRRKR